MSNNDQPSLFISPKLVEDIYGLIDSAVGHIPLAAGFKLEPHCSEGYFISAFGDRSSHLATMCVYKSARKTAIFLQS